MTTIQKLTLQLWVKRNLGVALEGLAYPFVPRMTLREAAKALGVSPSIVHRWADPESTRGVPEGPRLRRTVRWIEKRLRIEAPK